MKICFLTDSVFTLGGVQRVISVLSSELVNSNNVDIVMIYGCEENRELYNLNNKVQVKNLHIDKESNILTRGIVKILKDINSYTGIFNNKIFEPIMKNLYYPKNVINKYREFFKCNKYDVIIASQSYFMLLLAIISDDIDAKIVAWQHNSYNSYFETRGRHFYNKEVLFNKYKEKFYKYVVLTKDDKEYLKKVYNLNAEVIHNPLSFNSSKKSELKSNRIIAIGRLANQKGFDLLIEAYSKICRRHLEWRLDIYGDGPLKDNLKELIKKNNTEQFIRLMGTTKNVKEELLNSSIFVLSSRWEGFGLVITEAMECGLPIIAFNTTGSNEIIKNQETGILVENSNIEKLAMAIEDLINDKSKINKFANKSILEAKKYHVKDIARKWESILREDDK